MRVDVLQHVGFESPAHVLTWAQARGHETTVHRLDLSPTLPPAAAVDLLVVMGGPMGADDDAVHPVLAAEKRLIAEVLARPAGHVLGICLGAQLLARALGARVAPQGHQEIGWFDVERTPESANVRLLGGVPERFRAFHWHGDAFGLPQGAVPLFRSAGCAQQGYLAANGRALGLQFHPEVDAATVRSMLDHEGHELTSGGRFVQTRDAIGAGCDAATLAQLERVLFTLLDAFAPTPTR